MKELDGSNFESEVLGSSLPAVVEIWGSWWQTCQILTAQVETLSKEEYEGIVNFYILDAGANRGFITALKVKGVPSFMFYKNGHLFDTMIGNHLKKEEIREKTEALRQWEPGN